MSFSDSFVQIFSPPFDSWKTRILDVTSCVCVVVCVCIAPSGGKKKNQTATGEERQTRVTRLLLDFLVLLFWYFLFGPLKASHRLVQSIVTPTGEPTGGEKKEVKVKPRLLPKVCLSW